MGTTQVKVLLLGILLCSSLAAEGSVQERPATSHSHNDYLQDEPLQEAIQLEFDSVEADIWLRHNELMLSHWGIILKGSLKEKYLDPLQDLVNKNGSVYGDDKPFYLWVDIKGKDPKIVPELQRLLSDYPMLTVFTDDLVVQGPVTIILTGNEKLKTAYAQTYEKRYAVRDSNHYSDEDPMSNNRWSWYALKWKNHFKWEGKGKMPYSEKKKFRQMVSAIHKKGKRVRFYHTPEKSPFWKEAIGADVDLISTNQLTRLRNFIDDLIEKLFSNDDKNPSNLFWSKGLLSSQ